TTAKKSRKGQHSSSRRQLLQLCILRLGFFQYVNIGVGILPESEELLVGGFCFCCVTRKSVGARQSQASERTDKIVDHYAAVIDELLELDRSGRPVTCHELRFAAKISRVE